MALTKLPRIRTPLSADGVWIVPVSKRLQLGCLLSTCQNPQCPCTELTVAAYSFGPSVQAFGFKHGKLLSTSLPWHDEPDSREKPLILRLDVYTGELSGGEGAPLDGQDRRVAALADALDAEMLDELEAIWRRHKRLPSHSGENKAEIEPWEPGELVYWDQVFEVDRPEVFLDSGLRVVALDMYCVAPGCDCREASVVFEEEVTPGRAAPARIGRAVVSFDGKLIFEPAAPSSDARLRALWARYRLRHPGLGNLFERYERIRAFAASHAARVSAAPPSNAAAPASVTRASAAAMFPSSPPGRQAQSALGRWVSSSRKRNKALRRA